MTHQLRRTFLLLITYSVVATLALIGIFYYNRTAKAHDTSNDESVLVDIQIWAKASIADYLWEHVLVGQLRRSRMLTQGEMTIGGINLSYIGGPGLIQTSAPQNVENLVMVLNARSEEQARTAITWLDYVPQLRKLKKLGVVLLGDEACQNDWIRPYLKSNNGIIDVLFLVYDSPLVDEKEVFQWPLGVATYRGFPRPSTIRMNHNERPFLCNFLGTVYENSSRVILQHELQTHTELNCILSTRQVWEPQETKRSLFRYFTALSNSDFTLCPIGKNAECYRIYEALALGSVPIVEDVLAPGKCVSPLRILKRYNAPVIYIDNWSNLPTVLEQLNENHKEIRARHYDVVAWYARFLSELKDTFLQILIKKYFN